MATVGVYDFDYMNYEHVIPNLECAKLCTYFHNRHDIAVLAPRLEPERYTNFFVRKEYDEGWFPRKIFAENCEYGGRAFNPDKYSSLESKIERTIPNMHLYDRYLDKFGPTQSDTQQIKRILNCAHVRLELNEKPLTLNQLLQIMNTGKYTGIIFHDYDLARIKEAYDIIYDISSTRHFIGKKGLNPYPIGNKFPIMVNSSEELQEWLKITTIPGLFFLQYNGLMDNEVLYNLCVDNKRMARQIYYNVTAFCSSENDFVKNRLIPIFKQVIFLRRQHIKILLKYDEEFLVTQELKDLIELWNCWLSNTWQEDFVPFTQNLYKFCYQNKKLHYISWAFIHITLTVEQMRDSFQYIRERNYDLFKMFYEWDSAVYEKGEFVNEWRRDQKKDYSK